jgi:hypothetical protein
LTASLFLVFVICLPVSIAARAKVGGDVNNCALSLFFIVVWAMVLLGQALKHEPGLGSFPISKAAFSFVCSMICWSIASGAPEWVYSVYRELRVGSGLNRVTQVQQYSNAHPGEAYFPWYPLPCLLGEGRLYHFSYGVFDRELAGRPMSEKHFLKYVPREARYICFHDAPMRDFPEEYVLSYLQNFHEVPAPEGLENWTVYQRD